MKTALLSTAYFGPIQWYQKLFCFDHVLLERNDHFVKQTYRNRCVIATESGPLSLTVPVEGTGGEKIEMKDLRISDHGSWRRNHWNAICSAYGESPFFEFYADDLKPFFEPRWEFLCDFNLDITLKMCELIGFQPKIEATDHYLSAEEIAADGSIDDFREVIRPKHPLPDPDFQPRPYWQVFQHRLGFLPNLSILDLLCNEGPEAILLLAG